MKSNPDITQALKILDTKAPEINFSPSSAPATIQQIAKYVHNFSIS